MHLTEAVTGLNFSLAASLSASTTDRFTTCKQVYYSLYTLCSLLPPPFSPLKVQRGIVPPPTSAEWESALSAILDLLSGRAVPLNVNLIKLGCDCLCRVFDACRIASRSTCTSTGEPGMQIKELDFNKTLFELTERVEDTSQYSVGCRHAAVVALGRLGNWAGGKSVCNLSNTLCRVIIGTYIPLSIAASDALLDVLDGMHAGGPNFPTNVISKAALKICTDRSVGHHLRKWGPRLAAALVGCSDDWSSCMSLLSACIKGMADEELLIRVAFATAVGNITASSVKLNSDKVDERSEQSSRRTKIGGKVHRMKAPGKWHPPLSESGYLPRTGLELLKALFHRVAYPKPNRARLSAVAVALITYLSDCRTRHLVVPSVEEVSHLMLFIVQLLDSDKLPHCTNDATLVRTVVHWIMRDGVTTHSTETVQLILIREVVNVLEQYNKNTSEELDLGSKALNAHQLQVCMVMLSNLVTALNSATGSLKDILLPALMPFVSHVDYGVRFETAVAVSALGKAHPHITVPLVFLFLSNVDRIISTLHGVSASSHKRGNSNESVGSSFGSLDMDDSGVLDCVFGMKGDLEENRDTNKSRLYTLHGHGVVISVLLQVSLEGPGEILTPLKEDVLERGLILIETQFQEKNIKDGCGLLSVSLISTCVRVGWTIIAALFHQGELCEEKYFTKLYPLWERSVLVAKEGQNWGGLTSVSVTQELGFLDASMRALLCFTKCCLGVLYSVPGALSRIVDLLDGAIGAIQGRLKYPAKPQGIVYRTILKASLMECFSWLPPGSFSSSCDRLFTWGFSHVSLYNGNGIASSLLSVFLNPQDDVLDLAGPNDEIPLASVPPATDFEGCDASVGMHAIVTGILIGHQEREAVLCSGSMWLPNQFGHISSEVSGKREAPFLSFAPYLNNVQDCGNDPAATPLHGAHWRRPAAPIASINIRLIDAAITILGATFGYVGELAQMEAIDHIIEMLPELYRPTLNEVKTSELLRFGALQVALPSLLTEDERKIRASRSALSVYNAATLLLSLLRSLPPFADSKLNVDLPWLWKCRAILIRLLGYPSSKVRRSAGEGIALLGEKVGDGFVIYLIQELLQILKSKNNPSARTGSVKNSQIELFRRKSPMAAFLPSADDMDTSSPALRAGVLFALSAIKRRMGREVNIEWLWGGVRSELAVGGDVPTLTRVWGLHSLCLIVQSSDDIINIGMTCCQAQQRLESKLWLESVMELLEVHVLDCWPVDMVSCLTAVLVQLMSALLQVERGFELTGLGPRGRYFFASPMIMDGETTYSPTGSQLGPFACLLALWSALRQHDDRALYTRSGLYLSRKRRGGLEDARVSQVWLNFAELVVALAPNEVIQSSVLPDIVAAAVPCIYHVTCCQPVACIMITAARILRFICIRMSAVAPAYDMEMLLFRLFEKASTGALYEGVPIWRNIVFNRRAEVQCIGLRETARAIGGMIQDIAEYDNDKDRPIFWILFTRAIAMGGGSSSEDSTDPDTFQLIPTDWMGGCSAWRKRAVETSHALGRSRWQVKYISVLCCAKALRGVYMDSYIANTGGGVGVGEGKTLLMDINKARAEVDASFSTKKGSTLGQRLREFDFPYISPRYICLFLEDILSVAVSTAMASIADTELPELQEAGVALLTMVLLIFGLIPDPNVSEPVLVHVHGKLVHRQALFLEQSVSQISSAVRPALSCPNFPPLVRIGCSLVSILVGLGLVVDPLVHRRLVRQIMPADLLEPSSPETSPIIANQSYGHPSTRITSAIAAEERFHRLATIAQLVLLSRGGDVLNQLTIPPMTSLLLLESADLIDPIANDLWKALQPNIRAMRPCWFACCVDAVRLKQGNGQWPSLPQPAKEIGLCYPHTNQTGMLHRSLNLLWPAMAAAFAMTSNVYANVSHLIIPYLYLCHFP